MNFLRSFLSLFSWRRISRKLFGYRKAKVIRNVKYKPQNWRSF